MTKFRNYLAGVFFGRLSFLRRYIIFSSTECDKDVLIDILTQRCNAQRMMIAQTYAGLYGRDLLEFLKEKLDGHFKDVIVGLMYSPPAYDAHELWHAMKSRDARGRFCLTVSGKSASDSQRETAGLFHPVSLCSLRAASKRSGSSFVKMCIFQALWEACQRRTGEHKNMLQMILCNKSHQQLFMDFEQFQNVSGQDIADAISECFDGYFQQLLLAIGMRNVISYFPPSLYMIETFKYVKGIHKVEEGSIFKRKQSSKTRGHSLRLEGQRFKSNIRKHYFTERVVDTWNSLPVEVVEAKTVIEFKQAWDRHKAILNKR
uniref:Uncharacterized protein n=1 Tax=Leptobrachium leishanense TaxID=445787 RepID=A0A8C5R8R9_9ANUR